MIRHLALLHQHIREACLARAFPEIANPHMRRLARAVASLPDRQHEVFRLARFEGLLPEQIARRMGISEATAMDELARAIEMIGASVRRQERKGW